jgi:hypothetical protein
MKKTNPSPAQLLVKVIYFISLYKLYKEMSFPKLSFYEVSVKLS